MMTVPRQRTAGKQTTQDPDTFDAASGTQFTIMNPNDVITPSPMRSAAPPLTNFEVLQEIKPPFRVNIAGVLTEVSGISPTNSGTGKTVRSMTLQDANGFQVVIRQLGSGADDDEILPPRRAEVFFLFGRAAWKPGEAGSLWAYEDSYVKIGAPVSSVRNSTREIQIRGE